MRRIEEDKEQEPRTDHAFFGLSLQIARSWSNLHLSFHLEASNQSDTATLQGSVPQLWMQMCFQGISFFQIQKEYTQNYSLCSQCCCQWISQDKISLIQSNNLDLFQLTKHWLWPCYWQVCDNHVSHMLHHIPLEAKEEVEGVISRSLWQLVSNTWVHWCSFHQPFLSCWIPLWPQLVLLSSLLNSSSFQPWPNLWLLLMSHLQHQKCP